MILKVAASSCVNPKLSTPLAPLHQKICKVQEILEKCQEKSWSQRMFWKMPGYWEQNLNPAPIIFIASTFSPFRSGLTHCQSSTVGGMDTPFSSSAEMHCKPLQIPHTLCHICAMVKCRTTYMQWSSLCLLQILIICTLCKFIETLLDCCVDICKHVIMTLCIRYTYKYIPYCGTTRSLDATYARCLMRCV